MDGDDEVIVKARLVPSGAPPFVAFVSIPLFHCLAGIEPPPWGGGGGGFILDETHFESVSEALSCSH